MVTYVGGTSWTRNTNCIVSSTSGYDTTGVSTAINGYGGIGATLISNRHVLLANHTAPGNTASMGTTSCLYKHISAINSVMTSLAGTSYSLTEINMSSFANYS